MKINVAMEFESYEEYAKYHRLMMSIAPEARPVPTFTTPDPKLTLGTPANAGGVPLQNFQREVETALAKEKAEAAAPEVEAFLAKEQAEAAAPAPKPVKKGRTRKPRKAKTVKPQLVKAAPVDKPELVTAPVPPEPNGKITPMQADDVAFQSSVMGPYFKVFGSAAVLTKLQAAGVRRLSEATTPARMEILQAMQDEMSA